MSLVIPALLTSTLGVPISAITASIIASTDSEELTSQANPFAPFPSSVAVAVAPASVVATQATFAPSAAKAAARDFPIPRLAPVTMTT